MKIIRLEGDLGWALMPSLCRRVKAFVEKYCPETDPADPINFIRTRWAAVPSEMGLWLKFSDEDHIHPEGHFVAWIAQEWGKPYLFIYQAEQDTISTETADQLCDEMREWITKLNLTIAPDQPHIKHFEMATWRDADVWIKYLEMRGFKAVQLRNIIGGKF